MKRLLLVALMVLVTLVGMVGVSSAADQASGISNAVSPLQARANPTTGAVSTLQATANDGVPARAKLYYLTVNSFTGGDAITACGCGFHMASLSEIQDPSKLQYAPRGMPAYDSPAFQASDQFPDHTGWVRIGADQLAAFVDDCNFWQSSSDQRIGTMMTRYSLWGENGRSLYNSDPAAWWHSTRMASCSQPEHVWCVEDPAESVRCVENLE